MPPSGTGKVFKVYAESLREADHLRRILKEAERLSAMLWRSAGVEQGSRVVG